VDGAVRLTGVHLVPRHLGSEILLKQGRVLVSGGLATGTVTAWIPDPDPFVVLIDEGSVQAFGEVQLVGWKPETCDLRVNGRDVYYQAPGQFKVLLNPEVRLVMHDLSSGDQAGGRLSGDVLVAEGEFTRDFDRLIGSFASAFSRQQEAYSRPLTEILPVLKNIELDLHVEGGNFAVSSKFPFGETELTVDLDLRVTGTLDDLKLWDRMRIMPGGTITYKVVRRVFDVTQGSVDFTGDPAHPYLDVTAQTDVSYKPTVLPGEQPPAGFTSQELSWGKTVTIVIHLTGVYPNLTPEFSSPNAAEFDTADLQTLLLLGMTRKDLEGRSGGTQSDISINLFTDDVAGAVSKLLLAPFVDAVSLGFTQQGGFQAEAATKIGRALSVTTRVTQNATTSDYSAGFQFKITDRLSLEGRMKLYQEPDKPQQQTYEGKFRYLIPLE
jgi:hypothetical protein